MRLKFLKTVTFGKNKPGQECSHRNDPPDTITYEGGREYEIDDTKGHASRWLRRQVAEKVESSKGK